MKQIVVSMIIYLKSSKKHKPEAIIHFAELPSAPFSMLNKVFLMGKQLEIT